MTRRIQTGAQLGLLSALFAACSLAACGSGDDPPATTTPPAPTPAAPPPPVTASAAQVVVTTSDGPADAFTLEETANVRIEAAVDMLSTTLVRLNGKDVTASFSRASGNTLTATLSALAQGPNVLTVTDAATGTIKYAQRTLTRATPLRSDCVSLVGMTIPASAISLPTKGATVTSATLIAAVPAPVVTNNVTQLPSPQLCQVNGSILPLDSEAPPINFRINLPAGWNQKMAQMGGSGFNGSLPRALTGANMRYGPEALPPDAPYAVTRGFVTYGSDSGHQGGGAAWALNKEAFANYGYMQVKKTRDVALQVTAAAYGMQPRKTYYLGSSTGGREGLQAAQRYADAYDGILSQVPVIAWPEMNTYQAIRARQAQLGAGWIPPAKIALVDAEVRRQCDALDGLVDGYIASTFACDKLFDPQLVASPWFNIRCPDGQDAGNSCMSDAQIATLNLIRAPNKYPFALSNNVSSFAGWPVGGESTSNSRYSGSQPNLTATNAPDAFLAATVGTTDFNSLLFRPEDHASGMQYVASTIYASNPDLRRFRARGGKLLLKSNSIDYVANPRMITEYFESVIKEMGKAEVDEFIRYYYATGVGHGNNIGINTVTGAVAPYYVDWIDMLDKWVEDGLVPSDAPTVTLQNPTPPFAVVTSLPMCRYPTTPFYTGGDQTVAKSYSCR